ncbi:MAG: 4-alpha-glucanotransferase [Acidaminobacter sp.]|nr:4-alpha-glucanotransferase [Acidaminobacter sp.]MDK9711771.1 4-alpha-glucanotransferase [Acidaminobacter sp.]
MMTKRSSGILLPIFSLPGPYGIGDFGKSAYNFVDFLEAAGQKNWQILPLGVTSYGDSPYQCLSAFAGNPYFIDLKTFVELGYLSKFEVSKARLEKESKPIDYGHLFKAKMGLLKKAYKRAESTMEETLTDYLKEQGEWLRYFALYMAIKDFQSDKAWSDWDREYRHVGSPEVLAFEAAYQEEIKFWVFTQYFFEMQWQRLKHYANQKGVSIIGDLPIYVAEDSADVWARPDYFKLGTDHKPLTVAGVPPDAFSETGQLWGNPIYNWKQMKQDGYRWWIERIRHSFTRYDALRIDHFRGFEAYWEVEYGAETAAAGKWVKGPGLALFKAIHKALGPLNIIAEDLGYLTPEVKQLIEATGYPGMKVLQFAFDPEVESFYLPHHLTQNAVIYTGTHDNETISGWLDNIPKKEFRKAVNYLKLNYDEGLNWGMIRGAWSSTANLAVAPIQDFLDLDNSARINVPSTIGNNWTWRLEESALTPALAERIRGLTQLYGRDR